MDNQFRKTCQQHNTTACEARRFVSLPFHIIIIIIIIIIELYSTAKRSEHVDLMVEDDVV